MENTKLDQIDRRILNILQEDSSVLMAEIAERVGLSQTPCWKRIKRLEREGIIAGRVTILDRDRLGLGVTVIVAIRTAHHNDEWLRTFSEGVRLIPEVMEFYRMSGEIDYILKVVARDIADYDRIYRKITKVAPLNDVSSSFAMQEIKSTTAFAAIRLVSGKRKVHFPARQPNLVIKEGEPPRERKQRALERA